MEQKDIQAEKQLIQTWKSIMLLSWFTSIVGIGCWIQAGNEIIVGNMNKGVIWLIYGMVHIIVACFGIRFSKRKNEKLQDSKYIVRRKKGICILGIVTYCVTVCVFLLTLIFFRNELYSVYIYGLLYQLSADNFFFLVFHVPRAKDHSERKGNCHL